MRNAILCLVAAGAVASVPQARADLLAFGSQYTVTGSDFAGGDFTNAPLTLSGSAQTFDNGTLQITEHTTSLSGGAEFAEFNITSVAGTPLVSASGQGGYFSIYLNAVPLTASSMSSGYYFDFTTNGVPNQGLSGFGGIGTEADPNSGSIGAGGQVFDFTGSTPSEAANTTGYGFFETPFDVVTSDTGADPNATGYFLGIELTPASPVATPEPASLVVLGGALLGLGVVRRRSHSA